MITRHKCAQCGCDVLHDDGLNKIGVPIRKHPAATKYWKGDGDKIIEFYCGVDCGFIKYEEERNEKTNPTH